MDELPKPACHLCEVRMACQMNTTFLLMAQYEGKAIIPIEQVCRDYFSHLTPPKLVQKISAGEIAIPLVRIEASQKCAKGVHLTDLATYLDARVEAARREMISLTR
jgi:hypothetical protein